MVIGRLIFGVGGECMTVAQGALICLWFEGKELCFAFGFCNFIARVGTSVYGKTIMTIAEDFSVGAALLLGFYICCFCLLVALTFACLETKLDGRVNRKKDKD